MRKIEEIKELQSIELEILRETAECFDDKEIEYFLCGGSMLGAVRHGGFIPWDDDIDVFVPRKDYDRLLTSLSEWLSKNKNLEVLVPGKEGYPTPYIKIIDIRTLIIDEKLNEEFEKSGLWVDIFPLDHYPDSDLMHRVYFSILRLYRGILATKVYKAGIRKGGVLTNYSAKMLYYLLGGYQKICLRMDSFGRKMNHRYRNSNHLGCGTYPETMKGYYLNDYVTPLIKHKFEQYEFNIPKNYHEHLTHYFGNYMEFPPEDKRQRHYITSYVVDESVINKEA